MKAPSKRLQNCDFDQAYTKLYEFSGGNDGGSPSAGVIADGSGNLYGTTYLGGCGNAPNDGLGVVFRLRPDGHGDYVSDTLYTPTGTNVKPLHPVGAGRGGLIRDSKGNLFGAWGKGVDKYPKADTTGEPYSFGGIYWLAPVPHTTNYTYREVYSFDGNSDLPWDWRTFPANGVWPLASLILLEDKHGTATTLYGTTSAGGTHGCGTVFELSDPTGKATLTTLYHFSGEEDGGVPYAGLAMDDQGNLYGTTRFGAGPKQVPGNGDPGDAGSDPEYGYGVVFQLLKPRGSNKKWKFKVLHAFSGGREDGGTPYANVIIGKEGVLYGTTMYGGYAVGKEGLGIVFQLTPPSIQNSDWKLSLIWTFSGGCDGANPTSGLVLDEEENLYGVAKGGEPYPGKGVLFKLTPPKENSDPWTQTILHNFVGGPDDGQNPLGSPLINGGYIYGTTYYGGPAGESGGTVYRLKIPVKV